ncbi:MAG: hypothetical protein IT305_15185 [Chloroflexi bacterium]|nr:hypothetical protein [Chloroflexota bacterium]
MLPTIVRRVGRYAWAPGKRPGKSVAQKLAQVLDPLNPDTVFRRANEAEHQRFYDEARRRNAHGYQKRVAFMEQLNAPENRDPTVALPDVPKDKGIMLVKPDGFQALDAAISEAREYFKGYVPGTNKRDFDSLQGVPRANRGYTSALNALAAHPEVLRVVSNYMGMLPILYRINVLYSPNDEVVEASSQFFHLDPEDMLMCKIFVFAEDVDEDTGPTTALPADRSTIVRRAIDYRKSRVPDEAIYRYGGQENLVQATGPAGTLAFLDTCRCFHMGSRIASKPRYAIMIQYQTPYAAPAPLDGPLGKIPLGAKAIPPAPTELEEYLYGLKR